MQFDTRQSADSQREQSPVGLEPAESALNGGALPVVRLPPLGAVGDQRVQPVGLDPRRRGLALTRGAAPLGRAPLGVGTRERPRPVVARRGPVLPGLDGGRLLEHDHRADVPRRASAGIAFSAALIYVNARSVGNFGTFEYWFA